MDAMVDAIIKEVELQKKFINTDISSIYFGGGTPSLLNGKHLSKIMNALQLQFTINPNAEITLEANPDDIVKEKVLVWASNTINRISLGVQSFDNDVLQSLNRSHDAKQAIESISILQDHGVDNISLDLIYGIPNQSFATWQQNLDKAINLNIPHISSYALTIEENTVLGKWNQKGTYSAASEESYERDYKYLCSILQKAGYEHYEVSNFAKQDCRSKHNSSYWQQEAYLGIGPGAHSFDGKDRFFNISNNAAYIRALAEGRVPATIDSLSEHDRFNEYLLTGLRTSEGVRLEYLMQIFNVDLENTYKSFLAKCMQEGLIKLSDGRLTLTEKGFFVSDSIILEFMKE
jgi:oxygen-independent coproporphyrinogen-3 oxidase